MTKSYPTRFGALNMKSQWGNHVASNGYSLDLKLDVTLGKVLYWNPRVWYGWFLIRIDEVYERIIYLTGFYTDFGPNEDRPVETFCPR